MEDNDDETWRMRKVFRVDGFVTTKTIQYVCGFFFLLVRSVLDTNFKFRMTVDRW